MEQLTTKQAAERMGVTRRVVAYWCSEGFLKGARKFGRDWLIPLRDLETFERPKPGPKPAGKKKGK